MMRFTIQTLVTMVLLSTLGAAPQTPAQKQDTNLTAPKDLKTRLATGYTIPTVDISAEKNRQVVVDREPGQYLGHPN